MMKRMKVGRPNRGGYSTQGVGFCFKVRGAKVERGWLWAVVVADEARSTSDAPQ